MSDNNWEDWEWISVVVGDCVEWWMINVETGGKRRIARLNISDSLAKQLVPEEQQETPRRPADTD